MRLSPVWPGSVSADASLAACIEAVLELEPARVPPLLPGDDAAAITWVNRWLQRLAIGIAPIENPQAFAWPGPWIARVAPPDGRVARFVVMYGVPSGIVWDPAQDGEPELSWISHGYLLAAADIALARPPLPSAPLGSGRIEAIHVSPAAGDPVRELRAVSAFAGRGLDGDRYLSGAGTFPSGPPGSALTLIEAEVCESFDPPLAPGDHRRNVVTRGISLNELLGHDFRLGTLHCRGMRLCEPCTVVQRYAGRPVLRQLAHRGGLRADIVADGEITIGDEVRATTG